MRNLRDAKPLGFGATLGALAGLLLVLSPASLAAGDSIKLSGPSSVKYGQKFTYTVSGHSTRPRGARSAFPPNLVIVDVLTARTARCPSSIGAQRSNVRFLTKFHSRKVNQVLSHFSRKLHLTANGHAYGLCAYLLNFPAGGLYAHTGARWKVTGTAPTPPKLTVSIAGAGEGNVVSSSDYSASIDCDPFRGLNVCSHTYKPGAHVTLTASRSALNAEFAGWSGACAGTNPVCHLTMDAAKSVTATFNQTA